MTSLETSTRTLTDPRGPFKIRFPVRDNELDQDEEWFEFEHEGKRRRLRMHDYDKIYSVPGLYESLVYDTLKCQSPEALTGLLETVLTDWPDDMKDLRVLDVGAGNGIVAEHLRHAGVGHIVGLDIIPEAEKSARRDRPQIYDDYFTADLCNLSDDQVKRLTDHRLNCLTTVAALGFGDIPADAFANAVNLLADEGWIAMTIKEDFLNGEDDSGFARLVRGMIEDEVLAIQAHHRYCHRESIAGEQLFYIAAVARKQKALPAAIVRRALNGEEASMPSNGSADAADVLLHR